MTLDTFRIQGYAIVESVLVHETIQYLIELLDPPISEGKRRGGTRNLLDLPEIRTLAQSSTVRALVDPILGPQAFPVRGILFDKTSTSNWLVPWHQDVTIAVTGRADLPGFGPWSVKQGVQHVQPPASILESMLTVRLHLDACPKENGALRVLPRTHRKGKLLQTQVDRLINEVPAAVCETGPGGALLMRPLLLHASSASYTPGHRRVIHLDFAAATLPPEIQWAEAQT